MPSSALTRALGLVEELLEVREGDGTAAQLVGEAFFDGFTPEDRRRLTRWLCPRSVALLESLELPPGPADR